MVHFNKNRRIKVTIARRKGRGHFKERIVFKEVGEEIVDLEEGEEIIMVELANISDSLCIDPEKDIV